MFFVPLYQALHRLGPLSAVVFVFLAWAAPGVYAQLEMAQCRDGYEWVRNNSWFFDYNN